MIWSGTQMILMRTIGSPASNQTALEIQSESYQTQGSKWITTNIWSYGGFLSHGVPPNHPCYFWVVLINNLFGVPHLWNPPYTNNVIVQVEDQVWFHWVEGQHTLSRHKTDKSACLNNDLIIYRYQLSHKLREQANVTTLFNAVETDQ